MKLFRRFRALFRKEKLDAEMSEEIQAHLDALAAENERRGMSREEARYAAQRSFGGVEQIKERARDQRGWMWLEQSWQDLRYAVRGLRKTPSFTLTAVLTLALGIGVNTALFTVYNIVALRPLPVRDPDGLVKISGQRRGTFGPGFSYAEYVAYRDGNRVLSGLAAMIEASATLRPNEAAMRDPLFQGRGTNSLSVQFVSDNYFSVLGAGMALGRGFLPEENNTPGAAAVVVLSHLFWERHFKSDPQVLGSSITLNGRAFTIVGVTAPGFSGQQPAPPAAWLPLMMWGPAAAYGPKGAPAFRLLGRLAPGVGEQQAKADLDVIAARLASEMPSPKAKDSVRLERGLRFIDIPVNAQTLAATTPLLLGFGMVLVIACTNVANLLLARGVTRQQEMGVRLTLGAGRGRVIRQLLTENAVLCAAGALLGLAAAVWTLAVLRPLVLARLPADWATETRRWYFLDVTPDWRVFGFTAAITIVAVIAAGFLPAWHTSGAGLASSLKNEGTIFSRHLSQLRLRSVLVVLQVAVCLMLLSCAGLLARNFFALRHVDPGFDPQRVFWVTALPQGVVQDPRVAMAAAVEALNALPGVESAGCAASAPLMARGGVTSLVRPGGARAAGAPVSKMQTFMVGAEIFRTFGLPVTRGRGFRRLEMEPGARVVMVSESVARKFWPGEEPVGKTLGVNESALAGPGSAWSTALVECEVVGVVRDAMASVLSGEREAVYVPLSTSALAGRAVFVRPRSNSSAALHEIVHQAGAAGLTLRFDRPLSAFLDEQMLPFQGLAVLSGALGGVALLMAAVGLYGVMAFGVNQRVREIGIRMALGATAEKVVGLFVRQGMKLVLVGFGFGLVGGGLFALLLRKILAGLASTFDPLAFGGVTAVFAVITFLACWLPARRAVKVDPMVALRCE
jgi:predicted permease